MFGGLGGCKRPGCKKETEGSSALIGRYPEVAHRLAVLDEGILTGPQPAMACGSALVEISTCQLSSSVTMTVQPLLGCKSSCSKTPATIGNAEKRGEAAKHSSTVNTFDSSSQAA